MLERLQSLEDRYNMLNDLLSDPDVINDPNKLRDYSKEQSDLEETVSSYRKYKNKKTELDEAKHMLNDDELDEEMEEMVKLEIEELDEQVQNLEEELKVLLLPKDPNDAKNVIMEIRAAAGGD